LITCAKDEIEVTDLEMDVEIEVTKLGVNVETEVINTEIEIQETTDENNTVG
jgi:hypothetical protein